MFDGVLTIFVRDKPVCTGGARELSSVFDKLSGQSFHAKKNGYAEYQRFVANYKYGDKPLVEGDELALKCQNGEKLYLATRVGEAFLRARATLRAKVGRE